MRTQISAEAEEYRDERWQREATRQVDTALDAERFIDRVGFAACLTDARRPGPSLYVAVCGPDPVASPDVEGEAREIGRLIADVGAILVCGGLGGVMAASCRGAASAGGLSVGLLPGRDRAAANRWASVAIPTGLGELRNGLVVRAADGQPHRPLPA